MYQITTTQLVNHGDALKSLREKFARLIQKLGSNNIKGTKRYELEVDFCYAVHELENCPPYLAGKNFDRVANICNTLHSLTKPEESGQHA